jgi:type II secretory pathway predicted ATPase ExeA
LPRPEPSSDPFRDTPDPAAYVPREASEAALAALLARVERAEPAALVAPPGHGKTLLLHVLAERLPLALRPLYVPNPMLAPAELAAWTLGALGSPAWPDPIEVLVAYAEHLAESGGALVWLVDDAHGLPDETARWLRSLVVGSAGALRLVVAALSDAPAGALEALGPLVRVDALARAMEADETARYVRSRLAQARVEPGQRARCEAVLEAIHEASEGVPRAVSAACSRLLARRGDDATR